MLDKNEDASLTQSELVSEHNKIISRSKFESADEDQGLVSSYTSKIRTLFQNFQLELPSFSHPSSEQEVETSFGVMFSDEDEQEIFGRMTTKVNKHPSSSGKDASRSSPNSNGQGLFRPSFNSKAQGPFRSSHNNDGQGPFRTSHNNNDGQSPYRPSSNNNDRQGPFRSSHNNDGRGPFRSSPNNNDGQRLFGQDPSTIVKHKSLK